MLNENVSIVVSDLTQRIDEITIVELSCFCRHCCGPVYRFTRIHNLHTSFFSDANMAGGALGRLKASREREKKASNAASHSHAKNDEYMSNFLFVALQQELDEIGTEQAGVKESLPAGHLQSGKDSTVQTSSPQQNSSLYPPRVVHGWISGPLNETGVNLLKVPVRLHRC